MSGARRTPDKRKNRRKYLLSHVIKVLPFARASRLSVIQTSPSTFCMYYRQARRPFVCNTDKPKPVHAQCARLADCAPCDRLEYRPAMLLNTVHTLCRYYPQSAKPASVPGSSHTGKRKARTTSGLVAVCLGISQAGLPDCR